MDFCLLRASVVRYGAFCGDLACQQGGLFGGLKISLLLRGDAQALGPGSHFRGMATEIFSFEFSLEGTKQLVVSVRWSPDADRVLCGSLESLAQKLIEDRLQ